MNRMTPAKYAAKKSAASGGAATPTPTGGAQMHPNTQKKEHMMNQSTVRPAMMDLIETLTKHTKALAGSTDSARELVTLGIGCADAPSRPSVVALIETAVQAQKSAHARLVEASELLAKDVAR